MKTLCLKIVIKSVYFPIIGLFIGLFIHMSNSKYCDKILNEKYAVIYMMLSHVLSSCIICMILLVHCR